MPPCAVAAHGVAGLAERRAFQAEAPACLCEIRCVQLVLRGVPPSTVPATLALTLRAEGARGKRSTLVVDGKVGRSKQARCDSSQQARCESEGALKSPHPRMRPGVTPRPPHDACVWSHPTCLRAMPRGARAKRAKSGRYAADIIISATGAECGQAGAGGWLWPHACD